MFFYIFLGVCMYVGISGSRLLGHRQCVYIYLASVDLSVFQCSCTSLHLNDLCVRVSVIPHLC